jgi:SPFH domain / Band 7 family
MSFLRQFFGQLRNLLWNILFGNRGWAVLRFFALMAVIVAYFIYALKRWDWVLVQQTAADIQERLWIFDILPDFLSLIIAPFLHLQTSRYLLAPVGAVILVLMIGALYVQDIYELRRYRNAFRYLFASLFGLFYPSLEIRDGEMQLQVGEENLLNKIGGPGWVIIRPGNVVLFESLTNPMEVLAEGLHFIPRFEMIRQIVSLRDQNGYIESISAVTKDGVVVNVRDIHYIFRLWSGHRQNEGSGRTQQNPYPYSVKAVRDVAYNRSVSQSGQTGWPDMLRVLFEGEIQNYIRKRQLDQVTSPRTAGSDPRSEIHRLYETAEFRTRFRQVGAELVWYGIGHLEVENPQVNEQRLATWQAGWRGDAQVITAYSEALRKVYIEQGRAEAQADILLAIIQALREAGIQPGKPENQQVFLLRIAQLLEAMTEDRR